MTRYVGRSVPRVEDERLLTGRGRYTDDIASPGEARCVFVRSPHAHARIARIDAAAAPRLPGVVAVLTGSDYAADGLAGIPHLANPHHTHDVDKRAFVAAPGARVVEQPQWPFALERARHVGEIVAAVVAENAAAARDAAEAVEVSYEALPAVVQVPDALEPEAPLLWPDIPDNLCFELHFGDAERTDAALAQAALVVRREFAHNRIANCQMEPRAALGVYDAASGLHTLVSGSQGVSFQRMMLAGALKVAPERVRVVSPDVGGGFGARTSLYPEQLLVVWAARRLGRPVKWTSERSEAFVSDLQARDGVTRCALALDRDGRILGYDVEHFGNVGAHPVYYVPMANAMRILTTVYHVPAAHLLMRGVLTNTLPTGPYRGAGRPEMTHAVERLLDMAARRLGIERDELRRRNLVRRDMLPYTSAMGLVYESTDFAGCMERALQLADWRGFPARREEARQRGRLAGIGLANHVEAPVGAPAERAVVSVRGEGSVEAILGTQSTGQGHETTFAQVLADALGVPLEAVRLRTGDTDFVKLGGGTHSDRSMRIAGALLGRASEQIIEKAKAAAAELLEASARDVVFEEGTLRVAGTDRALGLFEVARRTELTATSDFFGRMPAHPGGAVVCELEVDPETGAIALTRYSAAEDVGRPINPMIVEGQVHGGIAQGVGQALFESVAYEQGTGQPRAGSFMDYALPRAGDLPSFRVAHVEEPESGNPLRVKGAGEGGAIPATAAVLNALCDALSEIGIEDIPMPATPGAVWQAMRSRKREGG
ncbi:MAG: xanthine dehydrogenase [Betaproteobacteria bacterium RIFCSPLOWO2_12_FULL_68_20]|nr:MAG: xanthine dehydrogenase [Betaproteobacteria bacterium RIFCSPLOWO2_12_FULL_68_20]